MGAKAFMLKQETRCFEESCGMLSSLLVPTAQGELCIISESYLFTRVFATMENKTQDVQAGLPCKREHVS